MVFEFRSTVDPSATNNSSGAAGATITATNYNPDAPEFIAKQPMMEHHRAHSGRATEDVQHGVERSPAMNAGAAAKCIRARAAVESKEDFNLGKFQWVIVNTPSAFFGQQIGE